jgi:hypothetical protein
MQDLMCLLMLLNAGSYVPLSPQSTIRTQKSQDPDIKTHTDPQKYTQTLIKLHKRTQKHIKASRDPRDSHNLDYII